MWVAAGPILSTADILAEEQYQQRNMFEVAAPPEGEPLLVCFTPAVARHGQALAAVCGVDLSANAISVPNSRVLPVPLISTHYSDELARSVMDKTCRIAYPSAASLWEIGKLCSQQGNLIELGPCLSQLSLSLWLMRTFMWGAGGDQVTVPAMLPVMTGTPGSTKWAGPALGHHTEQVLKEELGLDADAITKLQKQNVI